LDSIMRRPSTKDADEELARLVLESALHVPVKHVDKSPLQGMYDLKIRYEGERFGAGEVVSARDEVGTALETAAARLGYTKCNELTHRWTVVVKSGTILRNIHRGIPALLSELERLGIDYVRRFDRRFAPSGFESIGTDLDEFGIELCSSGRPTSKHPPGFYLWPAALAAWVGDGDSAAEFCEQLLANEAYEDVLSKLRKSHADERHAVIVLTFGQVGPHTAIDTGALPSRPPALPDGIDWLWIIASKAPPTRAIYWNPVVGWSEVTLDA
jgi:hypothetical protein